MSKQVISGMERRYKDYHPDITPKEIHALSGEKVKHGENTSIARYVWLPIEWEGDKPVIRWQKEWKPLQNAVTE